jgi:hypothetical protein
VSYLLDSGLPAEKLADAVAHDAPRLSPHSLMKAYLQAALRQAEIADQRSNYSDEILAIQQLLADADDRDRTTWSAETQEIAKQHPGDKYAI